MGFWIRFSLLVFFVGLFADDAYANKDGKKLQRLNPEAVKRSNSPVRPTGNDNKIGRTRKPTLSSEASTRPIDFTSHYKTNRGTVTEAIVTFGPRNNETKPKTGSEAPRAETLWTVGETKDLFEQPREVTPKTSERSLEFDDMFVYVKPSAEKNGVDVRIRTKDGATQLPPKNETDPPTPPRPPETHPSIDELETLAEEYVKSRKNKIRTVGPANYDIRAKMIQDLISFSDTLPIFKGVVEVVARRQTRNPIYNLFRWLIPRSSMQYLVGFREGGDPILIPNTKSDNGQAYSFLARSFRSLNKAVPIFPFLTEFFTTKGIPLTTIGGAGSIAALTLFSSSFTWTPLAIAGVVGVAWNVAGRVINTREKARLKVYNEVKGELEVKMQTTQGPRYLNYVDAYHKYRRKLQLEGVRPKYIEDFIVDLNADLR